MPIVPDLPTLRAALAALDDPALEALCLDHFPAVYEKFGRGQRRDEKQTLLLDYVRTRPAAAARLAGLLTVPGAAADEALRERYRAAVYQKYRKAHTGAFVEAVARDERVGAARQLELLGEHGIYVSLQLDAVGIPRSWTWATEGAEAREAARPLSWAEVLQRPGHLVVVGRAGCGKTTLLRVLAATLTAPEPATLVPDLAAVLPAPRPLPIFLPLRAFEYACCQAPQAGGRDLAHFLRFLDEWTARRLGLTAWPAGFLAGELQAGRAWLLLDALDEVAHPEHRLTIRNLIRDLADWLPALGARLLVTARVAAYATARLDEFARYEVRDLAEEERAAMAHAIYRGLDVPQADDAADTLVRGLERSPALAQLVRTPVMLWTAAVVQTLLGRLPETRAALYKAYVDILLRHSHQQQEGDVDELAAVVGGEFSLAERHEYLTYAAFEAHRRLEGRAEQRAAERPALAARELVEEILAPRLERLYPPEEAITKARRYLTLMVEHSGLLVETDAGYAFGDHLTMQEFLAGCYLGAQYYRQQARLPQLVGSSWWKEVLLFAVGYLAEDRDRSSDTPELLRLLAGEPTWPLAQQLTALTVAGEALLQLRGRFQRPGWYLKVAQEFADRLYGLLYAAPAPAPLPIRQAAGLVLGLLYGRPGENGLQDPRFAGPLGLPEFVPLPAGEFWLGEDDSPEEDERPRHRVTLDGFAIAKYPTTNAMFACFIQAGGYANPEWWGEAIADGDWTPEGGFRYGNLPRYWDDDRWNNPAQPVVGVSWYEAVAYGRWLTATLHDGSVYRLPTEAEWEYAARGGPVETPRRGVSTDRRGVSADRRGVSATMTYPWEGEWRDGLCNSREAGLEQTSPVGLFPGGASRQGVLDLTGNVWEWCYDWYGPYAAAPARNPTGPAQGEVRVLRGGSWYQDKTCCRCGFRDRYFPRDWVNYGRGFRCVRASPS